MVTLSVYSSLLLLFYHQLNLASANVPHWYLLFPQYWSSQLPLLLTQIHLLNMNIQKGDYCRVVKSVSVYPLSELAFTWISNTWSHCKAFTGTWKWAEDGLETYRWKETLCGNHSCEKQRKPAPQTNKQIKSEISWEEEERVKDDRECEN